MISEIAPRKAKQRLHAGGEIAFLDVREAGQFGEAHPLFAVPCPYSRIEILAPALVPRRAAPVLLTDAGDGVAERAARRLGGLGYSDISIVAGGAPGWEAAGLTLFKGVNVPSKTLGELAEALWHPATIDAATLRSWRHAARDFRVFDARPPAEFSKMHVPEAVCLPNGELAHRFAAAVPDAQTPVLISCAGRTRGIVGAIGLKLAGVRNPVFALENGTQGWALAGEELERGDRAEPYPALSDAELEASAAQTRAICERWHISRIDGAACQALHAESSRTTYLFDVRSAEEFAAGHLPGAVHAPGGQLVQSTDQWIGVRRARVVLADDTGLRAALAAFWLRQLGWKVYVLAGTAAAFPPPLRGRVREGGRPQTRILLDCRELPHIAPWEAAAGLTGGSHLLDLRSSQAHQSGHPTGAQWAIRPILSLPPSLPSPAPKWGVPHFGTQGSQTREHPSLVGEGPRTPTIVLLADEPAVAELAAIDLLELGYSDIRLLDGGMAAWEAAGLPVDASPDSPSPAEAIDFLHFVHDRHDGNLESSRRYLEWEQGLVAQLDADERAEFRLAGPEMPKHQADDRPQNEESREVARELARTITMWNGSTLP